MNSSFAITEKWRLLVEFAQCLIYCVQYYIFLFSQQPKKGRNKLFFTLSCWYCSNTFCEHQSDGQRFGTKFRLPSTLLLDSNHPSFVFFLKMIVMDMDHWTIFSLTPLNFSLGYFFHLGNKPTNLNYRRKFKLGVNNFKLSEVYHYDEWQRLLLQNSEFLRTWSSVQWHPIHCFILPYILWPQYEAIIHLFFQCHNTFLDTSSNWWVTLTISYRSTALFWRYTAFLYGKK